jgi:hypothetical protein
VSSSVPPPGGQPAGDDGPSEEEVRQYLAQMRGAPADQVIAEVVQGLLNAAQVKLGRQDARLLLDATSAMNDAVRGQVDEQLVQQVDQALSQLRLAQVEAEREVAEGGQAEPNDVGAAAPTGGVTPPAGEAPQQPAPPPQQEQPSQTSKLWIPGQ